MLLDGDDGEDDQEVLDDLEYEEQGEKGAGVVGEQGELDQESTPHYGVPCQGFHHQGQRRGPPNKREGSWWGR